MRGVVLAARVLVAAVSAQDKPAGVTIPFAEKTAPAGLKGGERVDVVAVTGSSISAAGKVETKSQTLSAKVEVVKVERPENPADPARPVQVTFQPATKEQADKLTALRDLRVKVKVRKGDAFEEVEVPPMLRLDYPAK